MSGGKDRPEASGPARIGPGNAFKHRTARLLVTTLGLALPAAIFAQPVPTWVSSTLLATNDGFMTLRWSIEGNEAIALFRICERHSGTQNVAFTDQAEMRMYRTEPGEYSFWVQACERYPDGFPKCGQPSERLAVIVKQMVTQPLTLPEPSDEARAIERPAGLISATPSNDALVAPEH